MHKLILVLAVFFISIYSNGTTYRTIYSGFWSNNNIWQNGIAPPVLCSDTIIITRFIEFNSTLEFLANAYVRIDSTGALCGHDTVIFNTGTYMQCYGLLENDVFLNRGGNIDFYPGARIIWTIGAQHTIGGYIHSAGAWISVGPWFDCLSKGNAIEEDIAHTPLYHFEQSSKNLVIERKNIIETIVYDISGRKIMADNTGSSLVNLSALHSGLYIILIRVNEEVYKMKLFIE